MNQKTTFTLTAIIFGIMGSVYTFPQYKFLTQTLKLGFGLSHNDHVIIGAAGLTIALVAVYKLITLIKNS
ncbi:hypothetical protein CMI48_01095 [Candidatus Pacearchaeota archaeon]|jgi:hypothetical protein|nr:hypothetical protein [Candidatus Pacearchaeota archaeon]|tara:strand:- start:63 stop:272 length:210 start_codon:yes stop_codon:yes gene_type:complete